jgi:hypothetical protein
MNVACEGEFDVLLHDQHTTVPPGTTVAGQIVLKPDYTRFGTLKLEVPIDGQLMSFRFVKSTNSY